MKKNFFKKLALVLALVLTVTSLNYVPASAAATPAFKAKKSVISLMNRYTYGVKNVPTKGKVEWKIGNTKVAKISQKGSVLAVGAGSTTVKATVKNSKGKTVKTLTQKVAVKAPVWVATKDTLKEGERTTFTKKYTATGAKVKFASSNTEVAKVSQKGSVLAVKAGKATITATFTMDGKEYATLTKDVTVEAVETAIKTVAQNTTTKLTSIFVGETKDVKASEFKIVNSSNIVVPVKSVTVDKADKTKVVIETYVEMKDGKEYTVTYTGKVESSAKFTATDGTIASLNVTPLTITADSATEIKVQTLDVNNVIVGEYAYGKTPAEVSFTIDTNNGYTEESKLHLYKVGDTATAKVVYHTFKYDDKGVETGKIEKDFTITAVKDATTVSSFKHTIAKIGKAPNWEKSFEAETKIATNDVDMEVFFNITDSNNNDVTKNYKVSSADTTKILVSETEITDNKTGVSIVPVAEGTGYILVKNKDNVVVASLPVVVTGKKVATNLVLDNTSFTIGNVETAANRKKVKATVKDQYGKDMTNVRFFDAEVLSGPAGKNNVTKSESGTTHLMLMSGGNLGVVVNGSKFNVADNTIGSYVIKVSATVEEKTVSRTFSFQVKDVAGETPTSYKLIFDGVDSNNKVDLSVADANTLTEAQKTVTATVAGMYDGVVVSTVTDASITFTKADGSSLSQHVSGNAIKLSESKTETVSSGAIVKNVETGNYKVTAKFNNQTLTSSFVVADSQPVTTVSVKKLSVEEAEIKAALKNTDNVQFYYDGAKVTPIEIAEIDMKKVGNNVAVAKVKVIIATDKGVNFQVQVPVNATFTLK